MSNNNFWSNLDSYSNFQQQPVESSQQNDEWSCSTDDWNYIDQSLANKNSNIQKFNSTPNSDLTLNNRSVPDPHNISTQVLVNPNKPSYNFNPIIENGQFQAISNNWFDKTESQLEQITNVQYPFTKDVDSKKSDNIVETDDNFWVDVENREILPPESFQNDSFQVAMSNLQINDEIDHRLDFID